MIPAPLGSVCQQETCTTSWVTPVLVVMLPLQQTKAKHGVLQPTQLTQLETTCSFPLLVVVTTAMVRWAALGPTEIIGRHRCTVPTTVAACTSFPANGTGTAKPVPTATPCGRSRMNKIYKNH